MVKFCKESLSNRIIIKPLIEKTSKGGIVIARDARSQAINTDRGEILEIGPGAWFDFPVKPDLKPGDKVYYSHYGAKTIKPEDSEDFFIICNDTDILVKYEE